MKKRMLAFMLAVAMTVGLSACGSSESTDQSAQSDSGAGYKDTIVYSLDSAPSGVFVPILGLSDYDSSICDCIYSALLTPDASGELQPYLAEEYDVTDDNLTYTFKLHDNAVWSDGEALTADDVAFTYTLAASPEDTDIFAESIKYIKGVDEYQAGTADSVSGIEVIDEHTISITLKEAYAKGTAIFGDLGIMPKHIWEDTAYADLKTTDSTSPVTCGPYTIAEYQKDEYVKLEADPNFFLGEAKTKNFYFKVVNADTITTELTSGEIDIAAVTNLTNSELEDLEDQGFVMNTFYYDLVQCMRFNQDDNLPKEFRQAIAYALDRQGMVDDLLEGRGIVADVLISAGSWAYPDDVEGISQDVDKAQSLLKDAGYVDVNDDGYVEKPDGSALSLLLAYPEGLKAREKSAVVIQEDLKQIGIAVELKMVDFPTLMTIMSEGSYDLMLMGHGVDSTDPDITSYLDSLGYSDNAKKLAKEAVTSFDQETRKELYKEIAEDQQENANVITLYCQEKVYAVPENMVGYEAGTFNNFYKVYNWAIEE